MKQNCKTPHQKWRYTQQYNCRLAAGASSMAGKTPRTVLQDYRENFHTQKYSSRQLIYTKATRISLQHQILILYTAFSWKVAFRRRRVSEGCMCVLCWSIGLFLFIIIIIFFFIFQVVGYACQSCLRALVGFSKRYHCSAELEMAFRTTLQTSEVQRVMLSSTVRPVLHLMCRHLIVQHPFAVRNGCSIIINLRL